jgi:hypothetical protein
VLPYIEAPSPAADTLFPSLSLLQVWQVRASYDAKPYRKTMMQLWCGGGNRRDGMGSSWLCVCGGGAWRGGGGGGERQRGYRSDIGSLHHSALEKSIYSWIIKLASDQ